MVLGFQQALKYLWKSFVPPWLQVIEEAAKLWKEKAHLRELQSRVKLIGGDFFKPETIPPARDGDVYLMRAILHDCESLKKSRGML